MTGVTGDAGWPNFPYDTPFDPNQYFVVQNAGHWVFTNTGLANNDTFGVYLRPDGVFGSVVGHETDSKAGQRLSVQQGQKQPRRG